MTKQERRKIIRDQTRQALVDINRCEQVRKEAIRATWLEAAEYISGYPGNTYTTDCDHNVIADDFRMKAKGVK